MMFRAHEGLTSMSRYLAFTGGLKCEIAIACGGEGAGEKKKSGKALPLNKLIEETAKRRTAFAELLLLDQQLWHACLSEQVRGSGL